MFNRTTPFDPKLKKRQQKPNSDDEKQNEQPEQPLYRSFQPHPRPQFSSSSSSSDSSEHELEDESNELHVEDKEQPEEQEEIVQLPLHEVKIPDWSPPRSRIFSYHHNPQRYRRIEPIVEDPDDYRPYQPTFQPGCQQTYQHDFQQIHLPTFQPDFQQIHPE